jgi:hypothetical protein
LSKNLLHEGVKDVKRAEEEHPILGYGRRTAEEMKADSGVNQDLLQCFSLSSTVKKEPSVLLQLSPCPSRLHVKGFG